MAKINAKARLMAAPSDLGTQITALWHKLMPHSSASARIGAALYIGDASTVFVRCYLGAGKEESPSSIL